MNVINIGQKLSICFQKNDKMVEMICSVAEVYNDRLVIDLPQYFMRYIDYLDVGNHLTVKIFAKVGTLDFNSIILSSPLEDKFSVELDYNAIQLTPSEEIPVINAVETLQIRRNGTKITAKTFEIATEYVKFYSDNKFEENEVLDCTLFLPQNHGTIYFKATLTEVDPIYENEYTMSDFCMTEEDRQSLLYYMYVYTKDTDWEE